jgi:hypothetical protein
VSSNNSASNDTQSSQTRGSCFFLYWKAEGAHCWMLQSRVKGRTGKIPFARRVNSDARKTRGMRHPRQRTVISCRELDWAAMAKLSCRKSNINVGRIACGVARHVGFGWLRGSHGFTALFYSILSSGLRPLATYCGKVYLPLLRNTADISGYVVCCDLQHFNLDASSSLTTGIVKGRLEQPFTRHIIA